MNRNPNIQQNNPDQYQAVDLNQLDAALDELNHLRQLDERGSADLQNVPDHNKFLYKESGGPLDLLEVNRAIDEEYGRIELEEKGDRERSSEPIHYRQSNHTLTSLAYKFRSLSEGEKDNVIQEVVFKEVQKWLGVEQPRGGNFLLNFPFPNNLNDLKKVLHEVLQLEGDDRAGEKVNQITQSEFEEMKAAASDIRQRILEFLENDLRFKDLYIQGRHLGKGGMGSVFLEESDIDLVFKLSHRQVANGEELMVRGSVARSENLMQGLVEATKDPGLGTYYGAMVMKDEKGGKRLVDFFEAEHNMVELKDLDQIKQIKKIKNPEQKHGEMVGFLKNFKSALGGIRALHEKGLVHRDLKPANISEVDDGKGGRIWKVMDYDLVCPTGYNVNGMMAGTVAYVSPEQAKATYITTASDIYTLGAIFYKVMGGKLCNDYPGGLFKAAAGEVIDVDSIEAHDHIKKLIAECTHMDPAKRPGIHELIRMVDYIIEQYEGGQVIFDQQDAEDLNEADPLEAFRLDPNAVSNAPFEGLVPKKQQSISPESTRVLNSKEGREPIKVELGKSHPTQVLEQSDLIEDDFDEKTVFVGASELSRVMENRPVGEPEESTRSLGPSPKKTNIINEADKPTQLFN